MPCWVSFASSRRQTLSACIPDQPNGICNDASEAAAVPKIVALAGELVGKSVSAIFISCEADPGLAEVRQAVRVPVVGAGSAVAAVADTVALACTGLVTIGMAPILQRELGILVVDPVLAGGHAHVRPHDPVP